MNIYAVFSRLCVTNLTLYNASHATNILDAGDARRTKNYILTFSECNLIFQ